MSDVQTRLQVDRSESRFTFVRVQDVAPILDRNKELKTISQKSDVMRHIATIPNVILEQWLHEEYDKGNTGLRLSSEEFDRIIHRKLQDPDWAMLRTDK